MPRHYHNAKPSKDLPDSAPRDAIKVEFANRLNAAMVKKGWTQSELARRASDHHPEKQIGRDSISVYMRGKALPSAAVLGALAASLGIEPSDLLPTRGVPTASQASPKLDVKDIGDGRVWLRINQEAPWPIALEIMKLLQSEEKRE